jgi:hypothetical protein
MLTLASRTDWGSVPDWIAGVGSVLAFAAFAFAFLWEVRKRRQDDEQDAEDRREALKRHARLVVIENREGSTTQKRLVIHNEGGGPILDVVTTMWVRSAESADGFREVPLGRRGPDVTELGAAEHGEVWLWLAEGEEIPVEEEFFPQIEFTDCDGRRWRRRDNDQPVGVVDMGADATSDTASGDLRSLKLMLIASMMISTVAIALSIIALA